MNNKPCRDCGITREQPNIEFVAKRNQCKPCYAIWSKEYRELNRKKRQEYNASYRSRNSEALKTKDRSKARRKRKKERRQESPEAFLGALTSSIIQRSKNSTKRRNKHFECNITKEFLIELYHKQDGSCAITRSPMTNEHHCLEQISVDRINSDEGYVIGNIQLLCRWVNLAKSDKTNQEVRDVILKALNGIEPNSL